MIAVAVLSSAPAAQTDRGAYVIRSFETELTVEADSNLLVEERIEVEFNEPRHGIFRTIPVRYSDPRGYAYSLDLRVLSATDAAGEPHGVRVTNEGRYTTIRLGDPDREVEGVVMYVLRYRVRDALATFGEHDEIYWNATGNEWNAPIRSAAATVRLPQPVARGELRTAAYVGHFGATERAADISVPEPGVVRFVATRPLEPLEGLTVAVGFPQGLVRFPSAAERAGRVALDNWVVLLPLGWFAFLVRRYRAHGRDPDPGAPVMVAYEPPAGLTPGGVGTLVDERVDPVDITATVVDLAVRRHLTIRREEREHLFGLLSSEETVFTREAGDDTPLLPHERLVLNALFSGRRTEVRASDLKNKFYRHLPDIRRALYDRLTENGFFDRSPEKVRHHWMALGFVAGAVTGILAGGWMKWRGIGPPAAVVVPILTGVLTTAVFLLFARAMPRRTKKGAEARQWALGFQEFAARVEADRLERNLADPRQTFEKLLPYAMALGVADEWAERFEGIYAEGRRPAWYVGPDSGHGFSTRSFERSLTGAMAATSRNMTASPRSSSGSGGGGSSGGGGGGGGGGSW